MWSGGITSWATARLVIERHGKASTTLLFADTIAAGTHTNGAQ
jgi:hypothetical protein